jgi:hypothetical protein
MDPLTGSGRIGIIFPDPHTHPGPADPALDPYQHLFQFVFMQQTSLYPFSIINFAEKLTEKRDYLP